MKSLFPGYYRPSEEEFKKLWDECIFTFDANVLLNLYRYTPNTAQKILEVLTLLKNRIWLPHQVAFEYLRNRIEVISTQRDAYDGVEKELNALVGNLNGALGKYRKHPFINVGTLVTRISSIVESLKSELKENKENHPDLLDDDYLRTELTILFDGKVGGPFTEEALNKLYKEAEQRYSRQIPPGYEDAKKPIPEKYGDVVLWYQLIEFATEQKKPVIFVTGDSKSDWWQEYKGKTLGPRPELIQEFQEKAKMPVYIYHVDNFTALAQSYLGIVETPEAIAEIFDIRNQENTSIKPYIGDIDGDGSDEVLVVSSEGFRIFRTKGTEMAEVPVDNIVSPALMQSFFIADVDNDGLTELICRVEYDTTIALVCYKQIDGRFSPLKGWNPQETESDETVFSQFYDANITDIDGDGKLEIVSEPWGPVPEEFIPPDHVSRHSSDPLDQNPWGRVSHIWKWNGSLGMFSLVERRLKYIGGR